MEIIIAVALAIVVAVFISRMRAQSGGRDEKAHELVDAGAQLLDVRTAREFSAGHIEGALNIPVDELDERIGELQPAKTAIVVYCASGMRSARAHKILEKAGFQTVHDLRSMANW